LIVGEERRKITKGHLPSSFLFLGHCNTWDTDGLLMTLKRLQLFHLMCPVPSSKILSDRSTVLYPEHICYPTTAQQSEKHTHEFALAALPD
jgi:hypothetical protein